MVIIMFMSFLLITCLWAGHPLFIYLYIFFIHVTIPLDIYEVRLFYISHFEPERSVKLSDNGTSVFTVTSISMVVTNKILYVTILNTIY